MGIPEGENVEEFIRDMGAVDIPEFTLPSDSELEYKGHDGHTPKENLTDKDTNPKDAIATNKVPLSLVPEILVVYAAMGFLEGALKYGKYNWRIAGVRSSIYIDALKRHIAAYESGEDVSENGVHHFSNMLACIGILADAKACGKLNDDRPPRALVVAQTIRMMEEDVARLREKFKDHHPHQYTIADSPRTEPPPCWNIEDDLRMIQKQAAEANLLKGNISISKHQFPGSVETRRMEPIDKEGGL